MVLTTHINDLNHPIMGAAIELDLDLRAERMALIDRYTLRVVAHVKIFEPLIFVPSQYANSESLTMIIFDDDNMFNAEVADHIKAGFENMK